MKKKKISKNHRHYFKPLSYSIKTVHLKCKCGLRRDHNTTKKEEKFLKKMAFSWNSPVHKVWHEFCKKFKARPHNYDSPFKYKGYDLSVRVAKWAEKHPADVRIVRCDDAVYAGSDLVFIEHQGPEHYHGTTVLYIPQCTGEEPICFFLYPEHLKELISVAKEIQREARPRKAIERKNNKAIHKAINKMFSGYAKDFEA